MAFHRQITAAFLLACTLATAAGAAPPTMAIWARKDTNTPYSSAYVAGWGPRTALPAFSNNIRWVVARTCPNREELALVTLDTSKDVRLAFFRDNTWAAPTTLCTNVATVSDRCYHAAYERTSGDLLVVYWNKSAGRLGYRTASGGAISGESTIALGADHGGQGGDDDDEEEKVRYVTLAPKPNSDTMMLLAMRDDRDLLAVEWTGSAWASVNTLETNCESDSNENYAAAYEALSGRALVVYAEKSQAQPRYRTYDGTSFSSEMSAPSIGKTPRWIRLAPRPGTDDILMVCLDKDKDINGNLWSGSTSTWGANFELSNDARHDNRRCFDVAFEVSGSRALIVYSHKNQDRLYYRTWTTTGGWSTEATGPELSDVPDVIALYPATVGSTIYVVASTKGRKLFGVTWNGSKLSSATLLDSNLSGSDGTEQFALTDNPATQAVPHITRWVETNPE